MFGGKKYRLIYILLLLCCAAACSGCAGSDYEDEDVTSMSAGYHHEVPVVEADSVSVSEEEELKIKDLKRAVYRKLIVFSDQKVIKAMRYKARALMKRAELLDRKGWKWYLSCVPVISWDCEKNKMDLTSLALVMFDKSKKNAYLMYLKEDEIAFSGFETFDWDFMQKHPKRKYVRVRADMITVSFVAEDNVAYWAGGVDQDIKIEGDVFSKLEKKGLAFSMEDITRPSNGIKISLRRD